MTLLYTCIINIHILFIYIYIWTLLVLNTILPDLVYKKKTFYKNLHLNLTKNLQNIIIYHL
jgi:hypothetical protein